MLVFLLQPLPFGAWLPRIPEVQARLMLGPGELALTLLGLPVGLILAMPFAATVVARLGGRLTLLASLIAFATALALPAFAIHPAMLFAALVLAGLSMSMVELGMNVVADEIEKAQGVAIMSRCHGCWSLGMAAGSLLSVLLGHLGLAPHWSVLLVAVLTLPVALSVAAGLPRDAVQPSRALTEQSSGLFVPGGLLLGICIVALGSNLLEGTTADWSAVYLTSAFAADAGNAGLGYSAYALTMAAGRFAGDWMRLRWGAARLVRACYALAVVGVALALFSPVLPLALIGYALAGFGGSVGVPLAISAAASLGDRPAAANVAVLTLVSLIGFFTGPPIVGFIGQMAGLPTGLGLLLLPVLLAGIGLAFTLRARPALLPAAAE
jgi:MFS family permease